MHTDKRSERRAHGFPKTIVFGIRQKDGDVRTTAVPNTTKDTLQTVIRENIEAGSDLHTDTLKGYIGLDATYEHSTVNHHIGQYVNGDVTTYGMEGYWNLLKRGYKAMYTQFSAQHTHLYLAEEDFRYNTRKAKDGECFASMKGINGKRLTYDALTTDHLQTLERE